MKIEFTVPGNPVPKARARKGKGNRWYTPERTREYEQAITWKAIEAVARVKPSGAWPRDVRYLVAVEFWGADARVYELDIDNVLKSCLDGCNPKRLKPFAWNDDKQVDDATIRRMGIDRMRPRTVVRIEVLETCDAVATVVAK